MPRHSSKPVRLSEAERLKRLRNLLGLSQREMADELRVTSGAIALWEGGERTLPGPVLKLIELYEEELGMGASGRRDEKKGQDRLPTSWMSRGLRVSGTAAGVTARFAAGAFQKMIADNDRANQIARSTQQAVARQVVESLGEMKGLLMKVGQMVSYMDFALPDGAREAFASLQSAGRAMAPSVIAEAVLEELGGTPAQLFAEWSPYPFAAASIGQVHRARLKSGERVAVKVQYPGIRKALETDLRNTAVLDRLGAVLFRNQEPGAFLGELKERFLEECDYALEARNQEEFRRLHAGAPGVRIPRVFSELSTGRVLTTELFEARSFRELLASSTQAERDRAGETMWQFAFDSIFRHGVFNGDPHPGNYLFDGDQVVFLDFGCVKRFTPEFMARWKAFARSVFERDRAASDRLVVEMGMVPDPKRYDFDHNMRMIDALYEPWLYGGRFRFNQEYVTRTWKMMFAENPNKFRMNLPRDWVFTNRLQWGLYAVLAELGAESDWRSRFLDLLYAPGERRPEPLPRR